MIQNIYLLYNYTHVYVSTAPNFMISHSMQPFNIDSWLSILKQYMSDMPMVPKFQTLYYFYKERILYQFKGSLDS